MKSDGSTISRKKLIQKALSEMENKRGTKAQIFNAISRKFDIDLHDKSNPQYKGFQQTLSKCFSHTKGFYAIKTSCSEYEALNKRLSALSNF